jgi:hypothetical protein
MADRPSPPRLSLTADEAAAALGLSPSSFKRHVAPDLRVVRKGSLRLYPTIELQRWLDANASLAGAAHDGR